MRISSITLTYAIELDADEYWYITQALEFMIETKGVGSNPESEKILDQMREMKCSFTIEAL